MAKGATENRKYLSHTLAEWACALKYEHLSPAAIEKAKLFWYDSLGCGLGGSQQEDAKILLGSLRVNGRLGGPCTCFVSGLQDQSRRCGVLQRAHDPGDGLQRHLLEGRSVPSVGHHRRAAGAVRVSQELSGKDLILATVIAYEVEMRLCEFGVPGIREYGWHHATLTAFAAPIAAGRVLNLNVEQMVQAIGISAAGRSGPAP